MRPKILAYFTTAALVAAVVLMGSLAAGGSNSAGSNSAGGSSGEQGASGTHKATEVRLGYFPNVTHAPALVGVAQGTFARRLGNTKLTKFTFNAGPETVEALFADALDIAYIGPSPSINAFIQSGGQAVRVISGSTSGGAFFVVQPGVSSASDLKGKRVASPQLGGTQDVALRVWLKDNGIETTSSGGGQVTVTPMANADALTAFKEQQIAGAWVPEPWASRLVAEGGGKVLVDEADLWPQGRYVTTQLLVRTEFLEKYPETVRSVLQGHLDALEFIATHPAQAQADTNNQIESITQKRLPDRVVASAWQNLKFTTDPIAGSLEKMARDAKSLGLVKSSNLTGIYALGILNELLTNSTASNGTGGSR